MTVWVYCLAVSALISILNLVVPEVFLQTLQSGTLPPGVALDDGAAARYCNEVVDVVYRSVSNAGLYNQTAKGICAVEL